MPIHRRHILASAGLAGLALTTQAIASDKKGHLVLIGDSILDNKTYVGNDPSVIDQVQKTLGDNWDATLLAVDGSKTKDVFGQLDKIPSSATHLLISSGGNDALGAQPILEERVDLVLEAVQKLAQIQIQFGRDYLKLIQAATARVPKVALCLIYDPNFAPNLLRQQISVAALALFNDRISRVAFKLGLPILDLRLMFNDPSDYANPIEPSAKGGQKIADIADKVVKGHDFASKRSIVYL